MALKSGFYNAIEAGGVYDRVYSADEYTNFYSAFLRDGVRRSGADDFKCTAAGLVVTVGVGYAICGSKWVHNDTAAALSTITPPVGEYSRIDGVFLHVDTNEITRAASFVYRTGTPAAEPQAPAKDSTSGVFELCLCTVLVAPAATSVVLTDTRANPNLCGWVTTPVGYDDYFVSLDDQFNEWLQQSQNDFDEWFANLRETLAVTTLFKQYTWYYKTTDTTTTGVTFNIPQYDPTGVDIVQVYTNGMLETAGVDYTLSGSTITFTTAKIANTEILVVVYKSIDGEGLGSVSDEVTALQNQVDDMQDAYNFNYICNGNNDNAALRTAVLAAIANVNDGGTVRFNIFGDFGIAGLPSESSTNVFGFGVPADYATNKKLILDFTHCGCINVDCNDIGAVGFFNGNINVEFIGLNLSISNAPYVFASNTFRMVCRNCRFWVENDETIVSSPYFAVNGTFINCYIEMTTGTIFEITSSSKIVKVIDCECYAYAATGASARSGYVLHYNDYGVVTAAVFTERLSCPEVEKTGYIQKAAILDDLTSTAHAVYSDTMTTLSISAQGQNVRGTITLSVPFMN
ncbi:MAG: hypothetical protein IK122_02585 [Alphaproteobacteria bacterium]|nr:hypothetical protein [Alphaproteobacteria bacterium]